MGHSNAGQRSGCAYYTRPTMSLTHRAQVTRFNSFAPPRKNINAKWYINGATYFEDVADAMEAATRCAFSNHRL